jgi:hypothetical protein
VAIRDASGRFARSASERVEAKLHSLIERSMKALVLEIDRELRRSGTGTPVDTGHARANWIPSVSSPYMQEVDGTSDATHDAGLAEVMAYKLASGATLYLTNNVPYIRRLNDGWSEQAPALFVERAIARALQRVKTKHGVDLGLSSFVSSVGSSGAGNLASAYSPFGDD